MPVKIGSAHLDITASDRQARQTIDALASHATKQLGQTLGVNVGDTKGQQAGLAAVRAEIDRLSASTRQGNQERIVAARALAAEMQAQTAATRAQAAEQGRKTAAARAAASELTAQARQQQQAEREQQRAAMETVRALQTKAQNLQSLHRLGDISTTKLVEGLRQVQRDALLAARGTDEQSAAYGRLTATAAAALGAQDRARMRQVSDAITRIRSDLAQARAGFEDATLAAGRFTDKRAVIRQYETEISKLDARIKTLGQSSGASAAQLRSLNQLSAQLASQRNALNGTFTPVGLAGNVTNALKSLPQFAMVAGGSLGAMAAQVTSLSSATTGLTAAMGPVSPAMMGVLGAATALTAGLGALAKVGVEQVKITQGALNVMAADGEQDLEGVRAKIRQLQEDLGDVGGMFDRAALTAATADIVKAGVETGDALALMGTSAKLAAAENTNLEQTAGQLLQTLRQYSLGVEEAGRVGDMLARAGLLAAGSVDTISQGLSKVAGAARASGIEMYDLLGMIVELDNKGMDAADKGATALNSALTALSKITKQGREQLGAWGIEMENADGSARFAGDILKDLGERMRAYGVRVNESTGELDGNGDAIRALSSIMDTYGARAVLNLTGEWKSYSDEIRNSQGALDGFTDQMVTGLGPAQQRLANAFKDTGEALVESFAGPLANLLDNAVTPAIVALGELVKNSDRLRDSLLLLAAALVGVQRAAIVAFATSTWVALTRLPPLIVLLTNAVRGLYLALGGIPGIVAIAAAGLGMFVNNAVTDLRRIHDEIDEGRSQAHQQTMQAVRDLRAQGTEAAREQAKLLLLMDQLASAQTGTQATGILGIFKDRVVDEAQVRRLTAEVERQQGVVRQTREVERQRLAAAQQLGQATALTTEELQRQQLTIGQITQALNARGKSESLSDLQKEIAEVREAYEGFRQTVERNFTDSGLKDRAVASLNRREAEEVAAVRARFAAEEGLKVAEYERQAQRATLAAMQEGAEKRRRQLEMDIADIRREAQEKAEALREYPELAARIVAAGEAQVRAVQAQAAREGARLFADEQQRREGQLQQQRRLLRQMAGLNESFGSKVGKRDVNDASLLSYRQRLAELNTTVAQLPPQLQAAFRALQRQGQAYAQQGAAIAANNTAYKAEQEALRKLRSQMEGWTLAQLEATRARLAGQAGQRETIRLIESEIARRQELLRTAVGRQLVEGRDQLAEGRAGAVLTEYERRQEAARSNAAQLLQIEQQLGAQVLQARVSNARTAHNREIRELRQQYADRIKEAAGNAEAVRKLEDQRDELIDQRRAQFGRDLLNLQGQSNRQLLQAQEAAAEQQLGRARALAENRVAIAQGAAQAVVSAYDAEVQAAEGNAARLLQIELQRGAAVLAARRSLAAQERNSRNQGILDRYDGQLKGAAGQERQRLLAQQHQELLQSETGYLNQVEALGAQSARTRRQLSERALEDLRRLNASIGENRLGLARGSAQQVIAAYEAEVEAAEGSATRILAIEQRRGQAVLQARRALLAAEAQGQANAARQRYEALLKEAGPAQRRELQQQLARELLQIQQGYHTQAERLEAQHWRNMRGLAERASEELKRIAEGLAQGRLNVSRTVIDTAEARYQLERQQAEGNAEALLALEMRWGQQRLEQQRQLALQAAQQERDAIVSRYQPLIDSAVQMGRQDQVRELVATRNAEIVALNARFNQQLTQLNADALETRQQAIRAAADQRVRIEQERAGNVAAINRREAENTVSTYETALAAAGDNAAARLAVELEHGQRVLEARRQLALLSARQEADAIRQRYQPQIDSAVKRGDVAGVNELYDRQAQELVQVQQGLNQTLIQLNTQALNTRNEAIERAGDQTLALSRLLAQGLIEIEEGVLRRQVAAYERRQQAAEGNARQLLAIEEELGPGMEAARMRQAEFAADRERDRIVEQFRARLAQVKGNTEAETELRRQQTAALAGVDADLEDERVRIAAEGARRRRDLEKNAAEERQRIADWLTQGSRSIAELRAQGEIDAYQMVLDAAEGGAEAQLTVMQTLGRAMVEAQKRLIRERSDSEIEALNRDYEERIRVAGAGTDEALRLERDRAEQERLINERSLQQQQASNAAFLRQKNAQYRAAAEERARIASEIAGGQSSVRQADYSAILEGFDAAMEAAGESLTGAIAVFESLGAGRLEAALGQVMEQTGAAIRDLTADYQRRIREARGRGDEAEAVRLEGEMFRRINQTQEAGLRQQAATRARFAREQEQAARRLAERLLQIERELQSALLERQGRGAETARAAFEQALGYDIEDLGDDEAAKLRLLQASRAERERLAQDAQRKEEARLRREEELRFAAEVERQQKEGTYAANREALLRDHEERLTEIAQGGTRERGQIALGFDRQELAQQGRAYAQEYGAQVRELLGDLGDMSAAQRAAARRSLEGWLATMEAAGVAGQEAVKGIRQALEQLDGADSAARKRARDLIPRGVTGQALSAGQAAADFERRLRGLERVEDAQAAIEGAMDAFAGDVETLTRSIFDAEEALKDFGSGRPLSAEEAQTRTLLNEFLPLWRTQLARLNAAAQAAGQEAGRLYVQGLAEARIQGAVDLAQAELAVQREQGIGSPYALLEALAQAQNYWGERVRLARAALAEEGLSAEERARREAALVTALGQLGSAMSSATALDNARREGVDMLADAQTRLNAELGLSAPAYQSEIKALEEARKKYPELSVELGNLIDRYKQLQQLRSGISAESLKLDFNIGFGGGTDKLQGAVSGLTQGFGDLMNPLSLFASILERINPLGMILEGMFAALEEPIKALQEPFKIIGEIIGAVIAPVLQLIAPVLRGIVRVFEMVFDALAGFVRIITFGRVNLSRPKSGEESKDGGDLERLRGENDQAELERQYRQGLITRKEYEQEKYRLTLARLEREKAAEVAAAKDNAELLTEIDRKYTGLALDAHLDLLAALKEAYTSIGDTLQSTILGSIRSGLMNAAKARNFGAFRTEWRKNFREALFQAAIDAAVESAAIQGIIGPAIKALTEAFSTPDTADDDRAIKGLLEAGKLAEERIAGIYRQLKPLRNALGIGGEVESTTTMKVVGEVSAPEVRISLDMLSYLAETIRTFLPPWQADMTAHGLTFKNGVEAFGLNSDRFGGFVGDFGGHVLAFGGFVDRFGAVTARHMAAMGEHAAALNRDSRNGKR